MRVFRRDLGARDFVERFVVGVLNLSRDPVFRDDLEERRRPFGARPDLITKTEGMLVL